MIGGARTISSHIGAGLDAAVKEVEVPSSTPELAVRHKGIPEDLEVPMSEKPWRNFNFRLIVIRLEAIVNEIVTS
jgi:hypothetical protein